MGMDEATAGVDLQMGDVTSSVTIKDGVIQSMSMSAVIDMGMDGVTLTMDMAMDYEINEMGDGVTVDVPDDLDSYTDVSELADTAA